MLEMNQTTSVFTHIEPLKSHEYCSCYYTYTTDLITHSFCRTDVARVSYGSDWIIIDCDCSLEGISSCMMGCMACYSIPTTNFTIVELRYCFSYCYPCTICDDIHHHGDECWFMIYSEFICCSC